MTVLKCEKCESKFKVPALALAGGRKVRCTQCRHVWFQPDPATAQGPENERSAGSDDKARFADALAAADASAQTNATKASEKATMNAKSANASDFALGGDLEISENDKGTTSKRWGLKVVAILVILAGVLMG